MKVSLKPRENARTRGKGHRHTNTLIVRVEAKMEADTHTSHVFACGENGKSVHAGASKNELLKVRLTL